MTSLHGIVVLAYAAGKSIEAASADTDGCMCRLAVRPQFTKAGQAGGRRDMGGAFLTERGGDNREQIWQQWYMP